MKKATGEKKKLYGMRESVRRMETLNKRANSVIASKLRSIEVVQAWLAKLEPPSEALGRNL